MIIILCSSAEISGRFEEDHVQKHASATTSGVSLVSTFDILITIYGSHENIELSYIIVGNEYERSYNR